MKHGKKYEAAVKGIDLAKEYTVEEAVSLVKGMKLANFDESVDIAMRLGVDPRKADQIVRGTVSLPHGIGKTVRVLVLTKAGPKQEEARAAGADHVGFEDYIEQIKGGFTDVDVIVATPDVMGEVGKLGRILGPRGLMPNPKSGTVTMDVAKAVQEVKAGKIEFRVDRYGILHTNLGKSSFDADKLVENITAFMTTVMRMKPSAAKGAYVKSIHLSSTMGPSVKIDRTITNTLH